MAEFDFRFAHGGLGGIEVGLGAVISGLSVVAVLLADGVFLVQRKNTVQVLAGLRELGLRLFHDAVGLTERRPVGIRLDLEQQLPLLDILPFVITPTSGGGSEAVRPFSSDLHPPTSSRANSVHTDTINDRGVPTGDFISYSLRYPFP